jgi:hypothetical protein
MTMLIGTLVPHIPPPQNPNPRVERSKLETKTDRIFPKCINFPSNRKGEGNMYETPDIIYEGELEVQAGSPVGVPEWDELTGDW